MEEETWMLVKYILQWKVLRNQIIKVQNQKRHQSLARNNNYYLYVIGTRREKDESGLLMPELNGFYE